MNSPIPTLRALYVLGRKRRSLTNTYQTTGSLCPCLQDKMALLNPQGCLTAQRNTRGRHPPSRPPRCPFPLRLHPQAGFGINAAEGKAQPLLPTAACSLPTAGMPCRSPPCNARAEQPALQLFPRPKAPKGERSEARQPGQEYPPAAERPRCSRVPCKFVRPPGIEFMRGDSSKKKVLEITA